MSAKKIQHRRSKGKTVPRPPSKLPCNVPECKRPNYAHGLCLLHYYRNKRLGSTDTPTRSMKIEDRLNQYREVDPRTGCWLWTKYRNARGYGIVGHNGGV